VKRTACALVAAALIATAILPTVAASAGGSTATVNVAIGARTQVTRVDGALIVRSNTAWHVVVSTREGVAAYTGAKTNGERIEVPDDTIEYWVVTD